MGVMLGAVIAGVAIATLIILGIHYHERIVAVVKRTQPLPKLLMAAFWLWVAADCWQRGDWLLATVAGLLTLLELGAVRRFYLRRSA